MTALDYNDVYVVQIPGSAGSPSIELTTSCTTMDAAHAMPYDQRRHQHSSTVRMPETPPSSPPQIYRTNGFVTTAVPSNGQMNSNFVALPPPSYEDAIIDQHHDPAAAVPPPSYDSIYGRVREAQKQSKGIVDFMKNIFVLLLGTIGCTIILGITIVIPMCMITFGSYYLHRCPQGEFIPIYLLIGGIMGVLKPLLSLSTHVRRSAEDQAIEQMRQSGTQRLINWFIFGWFMIGSYWIYRIYEPNYDPSLGKYCNETLYTFAFWLVTSVYILLGLSIICLLIISVLSVILHRKSVQQQQEQQREQQNANV